MANLRIGSSKIHGNGVFTKVNIPSGTRMFLVADVKKYEEGGRIMTRFGGLVNHTKSPNCEFTEADGDGMVYLRSLKNINIGEELTVNYEVLPFPFMSDVTGYKN